MAPNLPRGIAKFRRFCTAGDNPKHPTISDGDNSLSEPNFRARNPTSAIRRFIRPSDPEHERRKPALSPSRQLTRRGYGIVDVNMHGSRSGAFGVSAIGCCKLINRIRGIPRWRAVRSRNL